MSNANLSQICLNYILAQLVLSIEAIHNSGCVYGVFGPLSIHYNEAGDVFIEKFSGAPPGIPKEYLNISEELGTTSFVM